MDEYDWAQLPEPVLAHIFSFLPMLERESIHTVCKSWMQSLEIPFLWRRFVCSFYLPADKTILHYAQQYGHYMTHLTVELDQQGDFNRDNAVALLKCMANFDNINLTHLSIRFRGENPLFYAGEEFISVLVDLFQKCGESLFSVNLSGLQVNFTDPFIDSISSHCSNLNYLNILNKVLVCNVSPISMRILINRCRKLKVLHLYHRSLNDDVIKTFTIPDRAKLTRLGIVCRREEKCGEDISSTAWTEILKANPELTVELGFDHTCPLHRVSEIIKPEIPVIELHLVTFTRIFSEVDTASAYYEHSLEKLVVQTRPSKELDQALLRLAQRCKKLHTLCVYCIVDKAVIDEIFAMFPMMKKRGTYILKSEMEPEPWTVGKEEGD